MLKARLLIYSLLTYFDSFEFSFENYMQFLFTNVLKNKTKRERTPGHVLIFNAYFKMHQF